MFNYYMSKTGSDCSGGGAENTLAVSNFTSSCRGENEGERGQKAFFHSCFYAFSCPAFCTFLLYKADSEKHTSAAYVPV